MKIKMMKSRTIMLIGIAVVLLPSGCYENATKPLEISEVNPRYFTDGSGRAVYLTGSHTWSNLVDMGPQDPPEPFDFDVYLEWMDAYNHNFFRLWTWELVAWDTRANERDSLNYQHLHAAPLPYMRTGPGMALDGKPKFDLRQFNPEYFQRLRSRTEAAREHGIYASIMLFEGWGLQRLEDGWKYHPFHPGNNVNGIDGDMNGDGMGLEVHTLADTAITAIQTNYVRKVIEAVNDLDNVLYEISNENHPASTEWQYHMIDFIHEYEQGKPFQHPVGMTFQYRGGSNETLFESPADWISPNPEGGYRDNPPDAAGRKVIITDTDHLWGIGGSQQWVWKSFLRGMNPIFMDPYDRSVLKMSYDPEWVEPVRKSMGYTLGYAQRMNLIKMVPENDLASSAYCLAEKGKEYLVYLPEGDEVTIDLTDASGNLSVEWFNPNTGETVKPGKIKGGQAQLMQSPFGTDDALLYLK
jgi:hypothetical protein